MELGLGFTLDSTPPVPCLLVSFGSMLMSMDFHPGSKGKEPGSGGPRIVSGPLWKAKHVSGS